MDIQSPQADSPNTAEDLPSHRDQLIAYYESQIVHYTVCLQTLQAHHVPVASPMEIVPENAAMNGDETMCPSDVTDAQWERIEPLLPPLMGHGRPRANRRRTLNGIALCLACDAATLWELCDLLAPSPALATTGDVAAYSASARDPNHGRHHTMPRDARRDYPERKAGMIPLRTVTEEGRLLSSLHPVFPTVFVGMIRFVVSHTGRII